MKKILLIAIMVLAAISFVACSDYDYPKTLDGTWVYDHIDGTRDSLFVNNGTGTLHVVDQAIVYDVTAPIDYFSESGLGVMQISDPLQVLRLVEIQADCKSQCLISGYTYTELGRTKKIMSRIMQRQ